MTTLRFTTTLPAPVHATFADAVGPAKVGEAVVVRMDDADDAGPLALGTIVAAQVTDDGRALSVTVEVELPQQLRHAMPLDVGERSTLPASAFG